MTPIRFALISITVGLTALATSTGAALPSVAATGPSDLVVAVQWGEGTKDIWTLQCDPVGGTHPNRVRACAFLERLANPFAKPPTDMACTMVYSGPEQARVTGRWHGRRVNATFARNDGCATARWQGYRALLSAPGVVTIQGRVDLGPTCAVQQEGQLCEIVGAPATVTATSGTRTRTAQSGADGFLIRLPRGVWSLTADAGMHCSKARVDTRARPGPVVLSCDTGIRTSR